MSVYNKASWAFDSNRPLSLSYDQHAKYFLWYLASYLTGNIGGMTTGIWTLYGSSDSVTAGIDSTDRWALISGYDPTKLVGNYAGSNHSWIVLKSPAVLGISYYLIFDFMPQNQCKLYYSQIAPTGGSITARPTATYELTISPTISLGEGFPSAVDTLKFTMSGGLAADGSCYIFSTRFGTSPHHGFFFNLLSPSSMKSGDGWRAIVFFGGDNSNTYYNNNNVFGYRTGQQNPWGDTSNAYMVSKSANIAVSANIYSGVNNMYLFNPAGVYYSAGGIGEAASYLYNVDQYDWSTLTLPLVVYSGLASSNAQFAVKGKLEDMYHAFDYATANCPMHIEHAVLMDSSGTIRFSKMGGMWLPSNKMLYF